MVAMLCYVLGTMELGIVELGTIELGIMELGTMACNQKVPNVHLISYYIAHKALYNYMLVARWLLGNIIRRHVDKRIP